MPCGFAEGWRLAEPATEWMGESPRDHLLFTALSASTTAQDSSHDPSKIRLSTMTFRMVPGGQEAGLSGQATRDKLAEDMYANDKKSRASISRPAKATKKVHDYMPTAVVSAF